MGLLKTQNVPQAIHNGAMNCVQAAVSKGMDHAQKIELISQLNYLDVVAYFQAMPKPELDINTCDDAAERRVEQFHQIIAGSLNRLGVWALELKGHANELLGGNQAAVTAYEQIFSKIIELSIQRLDTSRPRIGLPIAEMLTQYLRAHQKLKDASEDPVAHGHICSIVTILMKRLPMPEWFLEMGGHTGNVNDWTDGRCNEQAAYREVQIGMFGRLCCYKPLRMELLHHIASVFDQLDLQNAAPTVAEVPLTMMVTLSNEISAEQKEAKDDNPVYQLVKHIFPKDLLHSPAITRHCLPFCRLLEMYYRFSIFFKGQQATMLIDTFFLDDAVLRPNVMQNGKIDREGNIQVVRDVVINLQRLVSRAVKDLSQVEGFLERVTQFAIMIL